jgi:ABC-type glycerol-3-phosphate transport system substrate-binding protein
MKDRFRLTLALAAACAVCIFISACGGGDSGSSSGTSASELTGTVEIWDPEYKTLPKYTEAVDQLDEEFEQANPALTVKRVAQPVENYESLQRAAFAAHEGPDIMVTQAGAAGVLSFKQGFVPVNDLLSSEMQDEVTLWEGTTADYSADGERYGVPVGLNGWVFYYNRKLFEKAGLPTEFQPQTWAEVKEAGEKLAAAGIQPFTGGNKEGFENSFWFTVGFQSENSPEDAKEFGEGKVSYTSDVVAKAFSPQSEMYGAALYPSAGEYFSTPALEGYTRFAEGKGAMVLGFWNALGFWGEFNPELGEKSVGTFFPPSAPLGTFSSNVWSITTFAKNEPAAVALLEFEMSKEGMEVLDEVGGFMPNRKDVSLPPDSPVQARDLMDALDSRGSELAPFAMLPATVAYGTIPKEISQVLQGRTSLEDAQEAMQETAETTAE